MSQDALVILKALAFVGTVALVLGVWFYSRSPLSGARAAAMRQFAQQRSYAFHGSLRRTVERIENELERGGRPRGDWEQDVRLYRMLRPQRGIAIPIGGYKARVRHLVSIPREDGDQFVFDHTTVYRGRKYSFSTDETRVVFRSEGLAGLPWFSLTPKAEFREQLEGYHESYRAEYARNVVPFDDRPGFADVYVARSEERDAVREAIPEECSDYLARHPGYRFSIGAGLVSIQEPKSGAMGWRSTLSQVADLDTLIEVSYRVGQILMEYRR